MNARPTAASLRTKVGALLVVASVFPLAIAAYTDIGQARTQLADTMSAVLAARADQVAGAVDALNDRYTRSAAKFARLPSIIQFCATPDGGSEVQAQALAALVAQPAEDAHVEAAAIIDREGVVKLATAGDLVGQDLSLRPFVQRAIRGDAASSDLYTESAAGRRWPTLAFAQPIVGSSEAPLGVLVLWLRASALWKITAQSDGLAGTGSFAEVFNGDGLRIAHSHDEHRSLRPGAFPAQLERVRASKPDVGVFQGQTLTERTVVYGVARRLHTQPWTLFYMVPKSTLDAQIAAMMKERLQFGGAIALLAVLAGLLVSRVVLRPILSLSEAAERLGRGELSARVPLDPREDELGQLVARFNAMAAQIESQASALSKTRDELEHRVADRTAELTGTARLLEAEVKERRATELELKRSQARFTALADAGVIGLMTLDTQGRTIDANDAALSIIGYTRAEVMSPDFKWGALTPSDWQAHDDLARHQLASERVVRPREKEYLHKDGHRIPVLTGAALLPGSSTEMVAFVLDLSERRRAEAVLSRLKDTEASEAKFRGLVEAAPDAVVILNVKGEIALVNKQLEALFGYARAELIGKPAERLVPERFADSVSERRIRYLSGASNRTDSARAELVGARRDGSEFPVEVTVSPLDMGGDLLVSVAIRDITERKRAADALARAKEEAESANRELEAFSYSVAHDLRAPLRGMNGFAQILLDTYGDKLDADGQDALREIVDNAQKMGHLIDALLSLARLTRSELRREAVDLSSVARELAEQLASAEPERRVDWKIEQGVFADADPTLTRAALQNLLGNAWKFSAKNAGGARIELGTTERDGERTYFVRDNGAGFDVAFAKKLFAPFQRLHTADEFPGTGIGLATVQRIVHRHGGRVWAEGAVSSGATFYFTLSNRAGSA